jgi:hypothetical protein
MPSKTKPINTAIKKLQSALPRTPVKRAATLATYLDRTCSLTIKKLQDFNIITSPEESSDTEVAKAVLEDIKVAVNESKMKRTSDTLKGTNTIIASISGENVSEKKCRKRFARK